MPSVPKYLRTIRKIPHRAHRPGEGILTRSACQVLQKIFDILTGGTHAAFTITLPKWRHVGRCSLAFAPLAAAFVVRARRRLGHRDRVGTRKAVLKPNIQRILEQLLVACLLLPSAP